ncbi:putative btb poz domain-containing protein [Diaporthe ampelina]|uniref:Putative btb poz domain-containing protein n=1 Tax=Diaporthe ampelina TaxID=1214573 RepID=A0A0G2HSN6_9PEZI|nr:putative btb poz domain-containing protein [Diaporthe ampelina]
MPPHESPPADVAADVGDDPSVVVRQSQSELRLLESGEFSDFTIVCGDREWKVHKAILSKVPYFNATVGGGFKEAVQQRTTIKEFFEPFEIQWLLAYIYFPYFDPETARLDTVSKSYLETCVRLWQLGDYFQVESMSKLAKEKLSAGCDRWRRCSGTVDTAKHGTTFIVDIEAYGISHKTYGPHACTQILNSLRTSAGLDTP